MSSIGYIYNSYGTQFNIAIANTYSYNVLSGNNLPVNTIIIASNIDENNKDTGTYSLLATDNSGKPVRLTYTIKQGNGFETDSENKDVIYLNIDNDTIIEDSNGLRINISQFKNDIVYVDNNKFTINTNKITNSSINRRGIAVTDNISLNSDENTIFVNTEKLQYANNQTLSYGIITGSDDIIKINNGIVSIDENQLPRATEDTFGVAKADEYTLSIKDNDIRVNTENLDYSSENTFGIIGIDNDKIISDNGILSVKSSSLQNANDIIPGLVKIDNNTITTNENGFITIPEYNNFINNLSELNNDLLTEINSLDEIKNEILMQIK